MSRQHIYNILIIIGLATFFSACTLGNYSPNALLEAREIIAQADSLRAEGQIYTDSTQLAHAYERLRAWRYIHSDDYAHACYHYGCLLRGKENPLAAMECFINATHSHTRDYSILGRVYSNMGDICHLADEYQLSYDMFEHSAEMYKHAGDTPTYYYALYRMAFELADLTDSCSCLSLLSQIDSSDISQELLVLIPMTKARLYVKCQDYNCAIFYAKKALCYNNNDATSLVILAQAYSYVGIKDSATYYAERVVRNSKSLYDLNNALYILTHDDERKDKTAIRKISAERADVQSLLETLQGKLSQSVQLLEQDIHHRPNITWLYAIIVTILIIGIIIHFYRKRQLRRHALLSQKVEDLSYAYSDIQSNKRENIENVCETLRMSVDFSKELCYKDYNKMCEMADNHFYLLATKLKQKNVLSEQEIRFSILVLIDYNRHQIAQILPYAPNGIGKLKYRVAQKLQVEGKNLRKYLLFLAIDEPFKQR